MATLLMEVHGIGKESEAGKKLKEYQSNRRNNSRNAGNFVAISYEILKNRLSYKDYSNITINELHSYLDELAEVSSSLEISDRRKQQIDVLLRLTAKKLNAEEWKWVIAVILKDVRINFQERSFLEALDEKAYDRLAVNSNLKALCARYSAESSPDHRDDDGMSIHPMNPFRPQMARNIDKTKELDQYEHFIKLIGGVELYIEEKLDGERLQLHMTSDSELLWLRDDQVIRREGEPYSDLREYPLQPTGKEDSLGDCARKEYRVYTRKFRYFSRNGNDYSKPYGEQITQGWLSPFINRLLPNTVTEVVFDGEVVSYDPDRNVYLPFGRLKSYFGEGFETNPYGEGPRYMIFDILYLNGQELKSLSLQKRKEVLLKLFYSGRLNAPRSLVRVDLLPFNGSMDEMDPGVENEYGGSSLSIFRSLKDIERYLAPKNYSADELRDRMIRVVQDGMEGLVVKACNSTYSPDNRVRAWTKFKPEHVGEIKDSIDALIIGAYMGKGSRGGKRASFLCGVRRNNQKFCVFCKVGGGFTYEDYETIQHRIGDKFQKFDRANIPDQYFEFGSGLKSTDWPHEWIRPQDSMVLEIKATEIVESTTFDCGLTLRFPRLSRVRDDKDYTNCTTLDQVIELRQEARTHLFQIADENTNKQGRFPSQSKKRRLWEIQGSKDKFVDWKEHRGIFLGRKFHVPRFLPYREQCLQVISSNGGEILASMSGTAMPAGKHEDGNDVDEVIIVCDELTRTLRQAIERGRQVVKFKYIQDCINAGKMLSIEPNHLVMKPTQDQWDQARYDHIIDEYGDPYERAVSKEELRSILDQMIVEEDIQSRRYVDEELLEVIRDGNVPGFMFDHWYVYLDRQQHGENSSLELVGNRKFDEEKIEFYKAANWILMGSGKLVDDLDDPRVNRVVVGQTNSARCKEIRNLLSKQSRSVWFIEPDSIESRWMH